MNPSDLYGEKTNTMKHSYELDRAGDRMELCNNIRSQYMNRQLIKHIRGGGWNDEKGESNNGPNNKKRKLITPKSSLLCLDSLLEYQHKNIFSDQPSTLHVSKDLLNMNVINPDNLDPRGKKIWNLLYIMHPEISKGGGIGFISDFFSEICIMSTHPELQTWKNEGIRLALKEIKELHDKKNYSSDHSNNSDDVFF